MKTDFVSYSLEVTSGHSKAAIKKSQGCQEKAMQSTTLQSGCLIISRTRITESVHKERKRRASPKVTPPILLCWPTISQVNVGGMAVEVEHSHQHSITCCCHVTDGSRKAVGQNGI